MNFKFSFFLISDLIIFFILSIYNAVVQQIDQKYTATFSTFLFCNDTNRPPVVFMYNHYVPLIIFSKKSKNKAIRKQTTIAFNQGLPGRKGKLNMVSSTFANKYAVVRSFGSSSIVGCSEKSSVITKRFESHSELVSSSLKMKVLKKKFLLRN